MAISSISSPDTFRPAYNPIQYVVSSTNVSRCDFLYIADVYINSNFVVRLFAEAGENDYGYFSIEKIVQDYISKDFKPSQVGFSDNDNSSCEISVQFKEQYNTNYATTCVGGVTISATLYTSTPVFAWNGALQYKELLSYNYSAYVLNSPRSRFLNFTPPRVRIPIDGYFTAYFVQLYGLEAAETIEIKTYSSTSTLLNTFTIDNDLSPAATNNTACVGVGAQNLNDYADSLSPSVVWIDSSVSYYTVQMIGSSTNYSSEIMTFEIDTRCTKFNKYRVWWLNRKGAFNSYNFDLVAARSVNTSQNTYTKLLDVDYSEGDRGNSVISVDAQESYVLQTGRLRQYECPYLEELFTSPEIYITDFNLVDATISITGAVYNAGTASFVLSIPFGVTVPIGTKFSYTVNDGSPIGMANSGSGTITGYDSITGYYETNVLASINAGGFITGYMTAKVHNDRIIPMVRVTASFTDYSLPRPSNTGIFYAIELQPSYKLNIQSF